MIHGGVVLEVWCHHLLDGLIAGGAREMVISPGSRSTPAVLAAQARPDLDEVVVIDERAAAFFALGRARVTRRPVLLLRTSGTAAAHDLPAVIEASEAGHPLVVISADRPHELMGARAPQTIDQTHLFGRHVRAFHELGNPDSSTLALRAVRRVGCQAASVAAGPRPGPVHVNLRARKPLEPPHEPTGAEQAFREDALGRLQREPAPRVFSPGPARPSPEGVAELASALSNSRRPLVAVGPQPPTAPAYRAEVLAWLGQAGIPVVAEATSQVRFGPLGVGRAGAGALLELPEARRALAPDLVLRFGDPPVSTGLQRALAAWDAPRWAIAPWGAPDPESRSTILHADLVELVRSLEPRSSIEPEYIEAWDRLGREAERVALSMTEAWGEGWVAQAARAAVPPGGLLAVGNSLPVRHLDTFVRSGGEEVRVLHQRGAAGIDGLVAAAVAASRSAPTVLLLGDVSLRHDLGALQLAPLAGDLTVVVIHNGGGRIFERLPVAARLAQTPERMAPFSTPSDASMVPVARALGWTATAVSDAASFERALGGSGPRLVEARVPEDEASSTARRMQVALAEKMEAMS